MRKKVLRKNIGLTQNNNTWSYVRMIPKSYQDYPAFKGRKNYRVQLGPISMSQDELNKKYSAVHDSYETYLTSLKNTNKEALEKSELIKQAQAFLTVHKLKQGQFTDDPMLSAIDNQTYIAVQKLMVERSGVFDELFDHVSKQSYKAQAGFDSFDTVPAELKVQDYAWKLLSEPEANNCQKHLISESWAIYAAYKGLDETAHESKRIKAIFDRFISIAGDQFFDVDDLDKALVTYVDMREKEREQNTKTPSPSTIERELNSILAILRVVIKKLRLKIILDRPQVKQDIQPKVRHVFNAEELNEVLGKFTDSSRSDYKPYKELLALIMAQSGTHISELVRLTNDRFRLEHPIPHIIIDGELKTKQRRRVIPLVYKVKRIKELSELLRGEEFVFGDNKKPRQEENYSTLMNKICKSVHPEATTYSFRHSFKHFADAQGIQAQILAQLGGWSGKELGLSRQMLGYGAGGQLNIESLKQLQKAMLTINQHLLVPEKPSNGSELASNVVYLHR